MVGPSETFRQQLAGEAAARGLAVWQANDSRWRPIPLATEPVFVPADEWQGLVADCRTVLSAFPLVLRWLQQPARERLRALVFRGLEGIEAELAARDPEASLDHATIRFDLFWHAGSWRVIEANCTIPAMQAYSDMARDAWLATTQRQLPDEGNTTQLLASLIGLHRRDHREAAGQGADLDRRLRIAILHRPDDSQMAELSHFKLVWSRNHQVNLCTPDQLAWREASGGIPAPGRFELLTNPVDLVYRHIFAWRLAPRLDLLAALRQHRHAGIYNPVSAHYEAKAFFALVSTIADDDSLSREVGLPASLRDAIKRRVPWTRVIGDHAQGVPVADIRSSDLEHLVFKCSYSYGGGQVFVGSEWNTAPVQERLRAATGVSGAVSLDLFLQHVRSQIRQAWIVQKRMDGMRHKTTLAHPDLDARVINGFADLSVFVDCNQPPQCAGGVSRFASGPVVNIGTGGGLAPLQIV
ncbi:MAG: hypothetical protein RIQ81_2656 [Pseudomonadota bacterium]|jgi:hypothetical protein